MNQLLIISGLSGAGKDTALNALEDIGFFSVDNVPPPVWPSLIETLEQKGITHLAISIDIRSEIYIDTIAHAIKALRDSCDSVEIVFLEATNDKLVSRFGLTRRNHPLNKTRLSQDLDRERLILAPIRLLADTILDTSHLSAAQLTNQFRSQFKYATRFTLRLVSFGYKYGVPTDVDILMDVRALPNPYYDSSLRHLPGTEARVQEYVLSPKGLRFYNLINETIASFVDHAKTTERLGYTVAIGCTGGQHRSVAVVERIGQDSFTETNLQIIHRDLPTTEIAHTS